MKSLRRTVIPATLTATVIAGGILLTASPATAGSMESVSRTADLIRQTTGNDGVKGKIKNYSNKTVTVRADSFLSFDKVEIQPGQEATYYGSRKTSLGAGGEGIDLYFNAGGMPNYHEIELSDPDIGRPDTKYELYDWWSKQETKVKTIRRAWNERDSHHEIAHNYKDGSPTKFWVKRENDGWDGGHETDDTEDWAVFTIHIDNI